MNDVFYISNNKKKVTVYIFNQDNMLAGITMKYVEPTFELRSQPGNSLNQN